MKIQTWQIPVAEKVSFEEIKKRLLGKGFISVVDEAEKTFREYTEPLKVIIPLPTYCIPSSDLLSRPDSHSLCYIEFEEEAEERQWLNLIIISEDELTGSRLLADCESAFGEQKVIKGTFQEAQIAERLEKELKQGTHGKLLSDPEFTSPFETLYDPAIRQQLHPFADTFGDSPTSVALVEDILSRRSEFKKSEIRRLVNNDSWFSKQFSLGCSRCGASALAFLTREEAQESLSHSTSRKCFMCEENTIGIVEAFALREALLKGLTQGLWLEHLIHQLVQPISVFSTAGVVLENFEMDVISLTLENVILFECKDTSFGERDFWMSVPKAQAVDADTLWIVTTEPLHDNVKRTIDRQKGQVKFKIFITENLTDQQSVTNDITQKMEQVQNAFLRNLFTRETGLYRFPSSLRRRFLRRPPIRR